MNDKHTPRPAVITLARATGLPVRTRLKAGSFTVEIAGHGFLPRASGYQAGSGELLTET